MRIVAPLALVAAAALVLSACAAAESTSTPTPDPAVAAPQQQAARGVSGEIAAISDDVLQVQNSDAQTAVSWTADTVVNVETAGTVADVVVGSCVVAIGDGYTVTSITVTAAVDGECATAGGFPGGAGAPGDGSAPTRMPTDGEAPEGAPSGAPTGRPGGGFGGSISGGLVTAVEGTTITLGMTAGEPTTVVIGAETAVTTTIPGDSTAFVVGLCVSVDGEADTSGGFAAAAITVSEPGDEGCSAFAGRMPGGAMPGGPGTSEDSE